MRTTILAASLLFALSAATSALAQTSAPPGKEYLFFRMYPDLFCKFDTDTDTIVAQVKLKHGVSYGTDLMHDKRHALTTTGQRAWVEIIDLQTMQIVDDHCFDEVGYIIRVDDVREQPGGKRWFVRVDKVEKKPDQFVIADSEWLDYDVEERKVDKRMKELPRAIRSGARISPDGKAWHVFGRDITIIDPESLEEQGKIELSKPPYAGAGPFSVRGDDFFDGANADAYRFLYTMRDPVQKNRTLLGVIDLDLKEQKVASFTEWGSAPRVGNWIYSRDRKLALASRWGGFGGGGGGGGRGGQDEYRDPQTTLVTFDLTNGKKLKETVVDVRNGLGLAQISSDAKKLYLTGRGDEIWVYDAEHKFVKALAMPGDLDGRMMRVAPR